LGEIPIREWLFGKGTERLIGCQQDHKTIELRSGGYGNESLPGQVPKTRAGRIKDVAHLNDVIEETRELGVRLKLLRPDFQVSRAVTVEDILNGRAIASFSLAPDHTNSFPPRQSLLPMPHLKHKDPFKSEKLRNIMSAHEEALRKKNYTRQCSIIENKQEHRTVDLTFANLLTLFPERWLDSVVLDAYLHILQENWPLKELLYLNSAEQDPNFKEIKATPSCYPFVLSILYLQHHWTGIMLDNMKKHIQYKNSQVVDQKTPAKQSKPWKELFPKYTLDHYTQSQQCNQSDCGVYSAAWGMMFLYYDQPDMDNIQCADMTLYRKTMLMQIILSMYLMPLQAASRR
jgi:hypothetical protein